MIIGTALGFSDLGTIALAVGLAFLFGYGLTSLPLLRAGLTLSAVIPIALASDTLSIAVMELVDNGIMLAVPGAMESGVGDILFWGALSFALVIAGLSALPVNRWLIARGKGHALTIAEENKHLVMSNLERALVGDIRPLLDAMHPDVCVHESRHLPYVPC